MQTNKQLGDLLRGVLQLQTNKQPGDLLRGVLQDKGSLLNKLVQDEGGHHHLETHHQLYGDHLKHEEGLPILKEEIFLPHLHMPKEDIKLTKVDMKLPKVDMKLPKEKTYCHRHRPPRPRPPSPPVMIYHRLYQVICFIITVPGFVTKSLSTTVFSKKTRSCARGG